MLEKLKMLALRREDLETQLEEPGIYGDAEKLRAINRELKEIIPVVEAYQAYRKAESDRLAAEELLHDPDFRELAQEELERAKAEIERLGVKMGCVEQTFYGLAGMGDLIVTATSRHSRNNRAGFLIGRGEKPAEAVKKVGMVVEGINALPAAVRLAGRYDVEMPIVTLVDDIVNRGADAAETAAKLMGRRKKAELLYKPAVLPYWITSAHVTLGLAWKAGVAAEVLASLGKSIGGNIYTSKVQLETETLFAWTITVILISILFESILARLMNRWKPKGGS
jgi:hypothetical protein